MHVSGPDAYAVELLDASETNDATSDALETSNASEISAVKRPSVGASLTWGNVKGDVFMKNVFSAYEEVVHWRRYLFLVPSGSTGKSFVRELARLLRTLAEDSAFAPVAMTAVMTMPHLFLQKPTPKS